MQHSEKIEFDFRSDTVTRPTIEMRHAMMKAEVGDDYYRDDPTVHALEEYTAQLFGKESALFTPSGTQSNLIAVMSSCTRGDAYIVGDQSHSYLRELGGVAIVASVQPQVVHKRPDGTLDIADIEAALYPTSILFSLVRLIALENTFNGQVLPNEYLQKVATLARQRNLRMHLDGARVFNAACAMRVNVAEIAQHFDTISFCLSKGLGVPVGSLLVGNIVLWNGKTAPRIGIGTWTLGGMQYSGGKPIGWGNVDDATSVRTLHAAFERCSITIKMVRRLKSWSKQSK